MGWTATAFGGVDGDFTTPQQEGQPRVSRPIKEQPSAFVMRITYWQYAANWTPTAANTAGPVTFSQNTYLVDESEPEDMGGGVYRWERVYASKPANWVANIIVSKTYQAGLYVFSGTTDPRPIVDQSIISWTRQTTGVIHYDYYFGHYGLPYVDSAPFIQTIKFFSSQIITDLGSGFPTASLYGNTIYSNNFAAGFVSASIEPYMGDIYCLKTITA
jgi:hypothetical protein